MTETIRNKRQTSEFPNQVGPNGGMDNDANNSNLNKVKKFFNKFMDAFDEMVTKIQNMVRSSEADGTVPTTAWNGQVNVYFAIGYLFLLKIKYFIIQVYIWVLLFWNEQNK